MLPRDAATAATTPCTWHICVGHTSRHAGLYRGIRDFAKALPGGVLSFDDAFDRALAAKAETSVQRIACQGNWLARRCHVILRQAASEAAQAVSAADLLVVHSLFRAHCQWASGWAETHKKPYWIVPHGCLDPAGMRRRSIVKRLWQWRYGAKFLAHADAIICATHREREKVAPWVSGSRAPDGNRSRVHVVPWPVEVPSLAGRDAARIAFRERLGIPQDASVLLSVGRLHSTKRPLETIAAFCAADAPRCHLVLIGMDEDLTRNHVVRAIPDGCRSRVHVVGPLYGASLSEAWLAGDGYISLSRKENFGYSAAEALSYGLPVILSPGHDLAYELPNTGAGGLACGWLLPDDSMRSAVEAITAFATSCDGSDFGSVRQFPNNAVGRGWVADHLQFDRFRERLISLADYSVARRRARFPKSAPPQE